MTREALRRSLTLARVHPWIVLSLGFALVFALAAMFTGVGFALFPWFACELFALSLGASGIAARPRGLTWLKAAAITLTACVLFGSVVLLAGLVFGPDVASVDRALVLPRCEAVALRYVRLTTPFRRCGPAYCQTRQGAELWH